MNSPLKRFLFLAGCCVLGPAACAAAARRIVPAYEITAVTVEPNPNGGYRITAAGRMRTGGHTNPRLRERGPRRNDELVLELVADAPPSGAVVTMVLQPVSAEYRSTGAGYRSVRVVGETNAIRRRLRQR